MMPKTFQLKYFMLTVRLKFSNPSSSSCRSVLFDKASQNGEGRYTSGQAFIFSKRLVSSNSSMLTDFLFANISQIGS